MTDATPLPAAERAKPVVAIDFGNTETVCALATSATLDGIDLVPNEMSNFSTPTLVSFRGNERFLGEAASAQLGVNGRNTINHMPIILGLDHKTFLEHPVASHCRFQHAAASDGSLEITVEYGPDGSIVLSPELITGMFFRRLLSNASVHKGCDVGRLVVVIPQYYTAKQRQAVLDACKLAGAQDTVLVTSLHAAATVHTAKHDAANPNTSEGDSDATTARHIAFVNIGGSFAEVGIVKKSSDCSNAIISSAASPLVSGTAIDHAIFQHFVEQCKSKHGHDISPQSKAGYRLLQECEKAKRILSTVSDAQLSVYNLFGDDMDTKLNLSRAQLQEITASVVKELHSLLQSTLNDSGLEASDIESTELIGGTTRVPFIKEAICQVLGEGKLRFTLDSASAVAQGGALIGAALDAADTQPLVSISCAAAETDVPEGTKAMSTDAIAQAESVEEMMSKADEEARLLADARNSLESYIFEMKAACDGRYKQHLNVPEVQALLNTADEYLMNESDTATYDELKTRSDELRSKITEMSQAYFDAIDADKRKMEADLQKEAEQAANEPKDDHDTRKLKKADRMRMVMKNKDEGTELFKGQNYEHAVSRYVKALNHTSKFMGDLSQEDEKEVEQLKLSLFLNTAMCYIKLEAWVKAIDSCRRALEIDGESTKALYRRAMAYEKTRQFEDARKDLVTAARLSPDDKAISALAVRVDKQIEREEKKAKKMYQNMFK